MTRRLVHCCTALSFLSFAAAGRELQQNGECSNFSNVYNCFVGGVQMGSVCINQCTNPKNPLFCQDCEDPRQRCAKVVPTFNVVSSTIHLGQGTNTQGCPAEADALQAMGTVAINPFLREPPNACASQSYRYDCAVGTAHVGEVCVPLCPNSAGTPSCIPCEDVRSNCAWAYPSFRMTSFITHFLGSRSEPCF